MLPCHRLLIIFAVVPQFIRSTDIHIGGLFRRNSPSENAFKHAVFQYNERPDRKFRLISNIAMLPKFDSINVVENICNQTSEKKVVAIFGGNFSTVYQDVSDLASTLHLPIFVTEDYTFTTTLISNSILTKPNFVLQFYPSVNEPLVDFLIDQSWQTFSYICNSGQCLYRLQRLIDMIHSKKDYIELNIDVRYISDVRLASKDLRNLNAYLDSVSQDKRILIDMDSKEHLEMLLNRIVLMGMNRPEYFYIIINVEFDDLDLNDFKYSGVNVTGFKIIDKSTPVFRKFYEKWRKFNKEDKAVSVTQAALMYDAIETFVSVVDGMIGNPKYREMLLNPGPIDCYTVGMPDRRKVFGYQGSRYEIKKSRIGSKLLENLYRSKYKEGVTGHIAFSERGTRVGYRVRVMSMEMDKGPLDIGFWNDKTGLNIPKGNPNFITIEMMKNKTLRVVSIISPPFLQRKVAKNGEILKGNDEFEGFCVDLLNETAIMVGFKYSIQIVNDNAYGAMKYRFPNGTEVWNGMIGELLNKTADIAVAPLTINLARARVVHFSEPFLTFGISVMIKKPGRKNLGIFSFLRPLANSVWACYFSACFIVSFGLYVITRLSPYEWTIVETKTHGIHVTRTFTLYNSVWFAFAALVQQGVDLAPKSPGARILSSVWWFFTLIMTAYYTANLVAFLTISLMVTPINDFADLLKPGIGIEYGSTNSGSTKDFFLTTQLPPFKQLGEQMKKNPNVFTDSVDSGVQRVLKSKGKYAFFVESRMNEYYNNKEPCETMMVGTPFGDKGYGIATPLNSPLKEEINDAVLKLREEQKLDKMYKTWWITKGGCVDDSNKSKLRPLTLINVAGVFYILTAGLTFALITSLLEFYYNARKNFRKQTKTFSEFMHQRARMSIHGPAIDAKDYNHRLRLADNWS